MFRKTRASSSPTSPNTGTGTGRRDEISDNYEVVSTPTGSNPSPIPSSDIHSHPAPTRQDSRRRQSFPSPSTPGVTPPPHIRQAPSRDDWYPSWLPRRPPPPGPASTVASEKGHGSSPIPFLPAPPSNAGTTRGSRPVGAHRMSHSYDTRYTAGSGYTGESYVDIGEDEDDEVESRERVSIGRRQTPRSVRIISEATAAASSRRQSSFRHSRRPSNGAAQVRSRKEGRGVGHVHGSGPRPWWRASASTPLSPTVVSPSPFPGGFAPVPTSAPPPSAVPPHMRAYLPHPGMSSANGQHGHPGSGLSNVRPRFRAPGLDLGFLSPPNGWMRLRFILWPIWIYGLVLLQTFFDLNALFCLVELALHPTPASPPSGASGDVNSSSSRNWVLGAAAYGVCWLFWTVGIVLFYEVVYCWWRRWRSKRPLMVPLYLSAPAYNIVCMTSYVNFCFFRHIRSSACPDLPLPRFIRACGSSSSGSTIASRAVTPSLIAEARDSQQREREVSSPTTAEGKDNMPIIPPMSIRNPVINPLSSLASWGDWFAETCYFYGQNLPTVALLVPRAGLCIALLLAYSSAQPEDKALEALGLMKRDQTFFNADGSLSGYARGVLLANVAWAAWRVLILLVSWIGLWWMSGQMCAGACGPRFRWEEPEEKLGFNGRTLDEEQMEEAQGVLATWGWRDCTLARVYDAYDLCLFLPPSVKAAAAAKEPSEKQAQRVGGQMDEEEEDEVLDRVLAAAGLPTVPPPARRGVLRNELFNTPPTVRRELSDEGLIQEIIISSPKPAAREGSSKSSREHSPANMSPYPFTTYPARQGSQDAVPSQERIPFPPSPRTSKHSDREGTPQEVEDEEEEVDDYDGEEDYDEFGLGIEEPSSSGRNSASMSSLGQQIPSRFPFQFRNVSRRSRGGRSSAGTHHTNSNSNKTSSASYGPSHASRTTSQSHSNSQRESQVSENRWSQSQRSPNASMVQSPVSPDNGTGSSSYGSPISGIFQGSQNAIPMPPRQTHKQRRQRASLPTIPVSALPASYPEVRDRSRTLSGGTQASAGLNLNPHPLYESSTDEEDGDRVHGADEFGMLTDPEAEGSQEEAEREDSVGLLSGGVSPRSSLGMLRSRSNLSLTNLNLAVPGSRRSRHSSGSSMSNSRSSHGSRSASLSGSGSRGPSARSRSMSAAARSRAQSLIQGIGAASRSNVSIEMGMRSRASSLARLSEVPSVHRRSGESGMGSFSGGSMASPSQHRANPEDYTFGQPIRLRVESGSEGGHSLSQKSSPRERSPPPMPAASQAVASPEAEPSRTVRESQSHASGLAPSERSQQTMQQSVPSIIPASSSLPIPTSGARPMYGGSSFISSAHESFITRPTTNDGSSETAGKTPSSFDTMTYDPEHVHGQQGSGWRPA